MFQDNKTKRRSCGFTLIELLVVVIVIGILAAIAIPNFLSMQDKARTTSVRTNMRTTQMAAESFATDNGGTYPDAPPDGANAFSTYFPGGNSGGGIVGNPPVNPYNTAAVWTDFLSIVIADVPTERATGPTAAAVTANGTGQIGYAAIGASPTGTNADSYGIEGVDGTGNAIAGSAPNTTLVLSNR